MTDSLFHMQRYWGSDDSDVESDKEASSKLSHVLKHAKREKKKNKQVDTAPTANGDVSEPSAANDTYCEPKRKKQKVKHVEINIVEENGTIASYNNDDIERSTFIEPNESASQQTNDKSIQSHAENGESVVENIEMEARNQKRKARKRKRSNNHDSSENNVHQDVSINTDTKEVGITSEDLNSGENNLLGIPPVNGIQGNNSAKLFPIIPDVLDKQQSAVYRTLPDWLANPTVIKIDVNSKKKSVLEMEYLDETTKQNLTNCVVENLFPVQIKVIPWLLQTSSKRLFVRPPDLCVSAPTGSGKTLAFVIPIVQSLRTKVTCQIRALVVLPVKDLASQVYKVFDSFCKGTGLRVALIVGFNSFLQEQNTLYRKCSRGLLCQADIIVTTPGRIVDHVDRTPGFTLEHLRFLVIDEADRMMEEIQKGWLKKIENCIYKDKVCPTCPCFSVENQYHKNLMKTSSACSLSHVTEPLQKLFYSATLSQDPEKLHELSLYNPKLFTSVNKQSNSVVETDSTKRKSIQEDFVGKYTTPKGLLEKYVICSPSIKPLVICHLIMEQKFRKVLCFTQSLEHSHRLHLVLTKMLKYNNVRELSSNIRAVQRKIILKQFNAGRINVLVCSDMMARGMDIVGVDCVISYDAPRFMKTYIHRIGRTARAGKSGIAITLLEKDELPDFRKMLNSGGKVLPLKEIVEDKVLAPLEKSFKNALSYASETIVSESSKRSLLKKGFKNKNHNRTTS